DNEFKAASRDGYGEDWPISYRELEPYYDRVESFIGVSGSREGLPQFPDGEFLPPMKLSCGALLAKDVIERKFGWRVIPDRVANFNRTPPGPPRVSLLRSMSARLLHIFLLQQPGRYAPSRSRHAQIHFGERCRCQSSAHGPQRSRRRRSIH